MDCRSVKFTLGPAKGRTRVPGNDEGERIHVAVDDDVDPTDINQVLWALSTRCNPSENVEFLKNTWSSPLDPSR